ncbi:CLUMA_CG015048, isoform A [Clunio marinus]|uniref:DnaJ homolog subfamily C member 22 n=1 Tax=Clunio marinus TaxID=568069 RepID=A0A1J1IQG1_9DIPT|nr:CLUMA_CG015048, isoform A [Clunio marinus]
MGEKLSPTTTANNSKSKDNKSNKKNGTKNITSVYDSRGFEFSRPVTKHENIYPQLPEQKSLLVAYLLWFFGGFFGLHHIYLHRDRHAFVWWCTLGGYFGLGWLFEVFKIPEYVRDANEDPEFISKFVTKMRMYRKPEFSTTRFLGEIMMSYLFGQLVMIAIPEDEFMGINFRFLLWTIPFFSALGVWIVGNIGRERGVFWHCLIVAYIVYPLRYFVYDETYWFTAMVFASALSFEQFSKQWRREPPKRHGALRRTIVLSTCVMLYLSLWTGYFYFNGKITDSEGDEVPVHEAIKNFLKSPWWTDLKQTFIDTWRFAKHNGWYETWKQIVDSIDADGEQNAYKVLGVDPTSTQSEITSIWRKMSREFHPDKVKDEKLQRAAQEKFMEIQQAYEIISKIKSKRRSRNKKFDDDQDVKIEL